MKERSKKIRVNVGKRAKDKDREGNRQTGRNTGHSRTVEQSKGALLEYDKE